MSLDREEALLLLDATKGNMAATVELLVAQNKTNDLMERLIASTDESNSIRKETNLKLENIARAINNQTNHNTKEREVLITTLRKLRFY